MKSRFIALLGNSILLSLAAISLAHTANLHVAEAATWEEVIALVATCSAEVLIFDLEVPSESPVLPL